MDHSLFNEFAGRAAKWSGSFAIAAVIFIVFHSMVSYFKLRHIPGPPIAAFTNVVRRAWVVRGDLHEKHTRLHRKYGTVVRVGPRAVLVSQPKAIEKIYGFKAKFLKSEFYDSIIPRIKGGKIPDVFATRDEDLHRQMRKPIANLYSIANLISFEPLVFSTMRCFFSRLDELFTDKNKDFDLGQWLQLFTFDVMGEVTFSRRLGFLEKGGDIENVMENNWQYFQAAAPNTQMPWLDYFWKDNPLLPTISKRNPLADFGAARIKERLDMTETERSSINQRDFLSCFIEEAHKNPGLPKLALPTWTNSNIQAGGDTTAIMASVILYYLLKNPSTLDVLQREIDKAAHEGRISEFVTWKESQTLPYLDACVKEASRLHPPIGFPLERIVPESGLQVDGYHIPPGTRVSMNPWAVHREISLYGDDAEIWKPERWMCSEMEKKAMYHSLLTFGAGHRVCLGKNLSYFEVYKLVPSLLQKYQLELVDPQREWSLETKWFTMPSGFRVRIKSRNSTKRNPGNPNIG
uniref:Pisatin demethylase n=1 Tax=Coccidioides posadasii RMSCC 3488 TaxID=454284 RepID=A0A0J6FAZ1_COCPO|nr:pisatin demethylase [Coccidioides posadasii RMSCC 3488]